MYVLYMYIYNIYNIQLHAAYANYIYDSCV